MARRTKRSRRTKTQIPVSVVLGFLPITAKAVSDVQAGGWSGLNNTVSAVVPYSPITRKITFANLHQGLYPMIAGFLVHKVVGGMFGLNRTLGRMGIPLVRI